MGWVCSTHGDRRGLYEVLFSNPEGNRSLGTLRRRWEDNIVTDVQEMECGVMDWISLSQDRERWRALVDAVMNLRAP